MPPYQGNGKEGWVELKEGERGRVGENEKGRVKTTELAKGGKAERNG